MAIAIIFIVLLLLPLFTVVVCSALQVHPSETLSIKNLEESEAWKKVKTISFGDGLLAQLHGTILSYQSRKKKRPLSLHLT